MSDSSTNNNETASDSDEESLNNSNTEEEENATGDEEEESELAEGDSSKKTRQRRRVRCGNCEGCTRDECGNCRECMKKVKFGGNGTSRGACKMRVCTNMQYNAAEAKKRKLAATASSPESETGNKTTDNTSKSPYKRGPYKPRKPKQPDEMELRYEDVVDRETVYGKPCKGSSSGNKKQCSAGSLCLGDQLNEKQLNSIVSCLGFKCCKKFHRKCAEKQADTEQEDSKTLASVLTGRGYKYMCEDCDYFGTSIYLITYFEHICEARADFSSSEEYVTSLFDAQIEKDEERLEEQNTKSSKSKRKFDPHAPPVSELDYIQGFIEAIYDESYFAKGTGSQFLEKANAKPTLPVIDELFLVGKVVRLYCPVDNEYHTGRIVNWRKASADRGPYIGKHSSIRDTEYLVRFQAGAEGRNRTVLEWIILEEHSLAVSFQQVWCDFERWLPGEVVLRTTLELFSVRYTEVEEHITEKDAMRGEYVGFTVIYGLLHENEGCKTHALYRLETNTLPFLSRSINEGLVRSRAHHSSLQLLVSMALLEFEEQTRVKAWSEKVTVSKTYPFALSLKDEYALPVVLLKNDEEEQDFVKTHFPRLCPLIEQGLDQMYVANYMKERWAGLKKKRHQQIKAELLDEMKCTIVDSTPRGLKLLTKEGKELVDDSDRD